MMNEEMIENILDMCYELTDEGLREIARELEKDFNIKLEDEITGGKRFRPSLTIIVNQALGGELKDSIPYAIIVELIHEFSLIHDDIMDHDMMRRGKDALWIVAKVGKAVMTGDAGFGKVVKMATELGPEVAKLSGSTIYALAKGIVQEFTTFIPKERKKIEEHIISVMNLKTASLFSLATQLGAISANADRENEEKMRLYGKYLGLAYQIADDLVDIKKSLEDGAIGDIRDHRITYPLYVFMFENIDLSDAIIRFGLRQMKWEDLRPMLRENISALDKVVKKISEYVLMAKGIAKEIEHENEYKDVLVELPEYMVMKMLEE